MNTDDLDRKEKERRGSREVEAEEQESRGPGSWCGTDGVDTGN